MWPGLTVAVTLLIAACADEDSSTKPTSSTATTSETTVADTVGPDATVPDVTVRAIPEGPVADLSEELTGGNGPFIGAASTAELPDGYVEHEFVAAGTATAYEAVGSLTGDGRWTLRPSTTAPFRTRVLVRRPADPADASGTVVVEWLNVSGGVDANPEYASTSEELVRQGHIWVGVSAQLIGVEGGPVLVTAPGGEGIAGRGLVGIDPARYGTLDHPGDGYSFDILTQVARAVRSGDDAVGGVVPQAVIAAGESQSALALTTYYNGVQPLTLAFDGFFVHSRASVGLPLVGPGEYADLSRSIGASVPTILRTDVAAPAIVVQAESDVVGVLESIAARQPDSDTVRLWEVAGTAHADRHLLGPNADLLDCGAEINDGPMHLVVKAALRGLDTWVRTGVAPASAPLLEVTADAAPVLRRDVDGIALGGLRTPPVDVPVAVLSGAPGPSSSLLCLLLGSTTPLAPERLADRYASQADYLERYGAAVDEAVVAGYVLDDDREALMGFAAPTVVAG